MTDLEALRRALQAPPDEQFGELDVTKIMATGTRIRRRRRVLVGGGAMLATAAVLVGVAVIPQLGGPAPAPPADTLTTAPPPSSTAPYTPPPRPPLGDVVYTGIKDAQGEVILYFVRTDVPNVPFGLVAAHMTASGPRSGVLNNETQRAGDAPGFHPIMGGGSETGTFLPVFGYFVGPAARIETKVLGKTYRARLARWSENPSVVVFWWPREAVPDQELLSKPVAYDANGRRLN
ncbi:hypothetical protein [Actinocrispum sp. NPDC049592]|uniref:hypothetical protein n=1 Tax=Actinocrispum sp. NPDC049592 TaxID=3154835 RepID=UPI00341A32B5